MRQALHIFRKDIRHLWIEAAVALGIAAAFAFTGASQARWLTEPGVSRSMAWLLIRFLLPVSWGIVIVRAIHAEALPGDRQFWLTRPYAWKCLLGAKLLFFFVFVNLPALAADTIVISAYGFPIVPELPGLLWRQVLLTGLLILPIAALSAITAGLAPALLTILVLAVGVLGWFIVTPGTRLGAPWFGLDWITIYFAIPILAISGLLILFWQYRWRWTTVSRVVGAAALILVLGTAFLPWTAAYAIQSSLSRDPIDPASIRAGLASDRMWAARAFLEKNDEVRIVLPLQVAGVPANTRVIPEGLTVTMGTTGGATWTSDQLPSANVVAEGDLISLRTTLDGSFYRKIKDQPVRLRGTLYLTLYGRPRTTNIPIVDRPVPVPMVGVCSASRGPQSPKGPSYFLLCTSAFRNPPGLVTAHFLDRSRDVSRQAFSRRPDYSPFPAEPAISPVVQYVTWTTPWDGAFNTISVATLEPIAHIEREFETTGLRLVDFEVHP